LSPGCRFFDDNDLASRPPIQTAIQQNLYLSQLIALRLIHLPLTEAADWNVTVKKRLNDSQNATTDRSLHAQPGDERLPMAEGRSR